MDDFILQTGSLSRQFGKQRAVDCVNINVPRGKVYGLLGLNGAEKSTLLKMICGMITPTPDDIILSNNPWNRSNLSEIGALIEDASLYSDLTAYENCRIRSIASGIKEERIQGVLQIVGLTNTGKRRIRQFSMEMKQGLGIALALLNNPKLLILDKPTNGFGPIATKELRELIRGSSQQEVTTILSSHTLSEVEHITDHIGTTASGHLGYQETFDSKMGLEQLFIRAVNNQQGGFNEQFKYTNGRTLENKKSCNEKNCYR